MNTALVADALSDVYDPELGVDIVSLGLIYGIRVEGDVVEVEMTTTSESCPLGATLFEMAGMQIASVFPAADVTLRSAEGQAWDVAMASDWVRKRFGLPPLREAVRAD